MSTNSVNPSVLFGGTWEQISGQFLLGAGEEYSLGETGGEATHTLSIQEIPSHNHIFSGIATNSGAQSAKHTHTITINDSGNHNHVAPNGSSFYMTRGYGASEANGITPGGSFGENTQTGGIKRDPTIAYSGTHTHTASLAEETALHAHSITPQGNIGNTGGGNAHNNLPPYLAVNIWQRIS